MNVKTNVFHRILSILLCLALLAAYLPAAGLTADAAISTAGTVADPGTADTFESMMGTEADGSRYAGRVWADKSVYTDGQEVRLNNRGEAGSAFRVNLAQDEAFQVVFSVLGSSMTTTSTSRSTGPMDVVLILDNSVSMNTVSGGTTRMQKVIESANTLLAEILDGNDVRLGIAAYSEDASTILPFGVYNDGVVLRVNNYTGTGSRNGVITAYNSRNQVINNNYKSAGYANYTNTQAGFNLGMEMLANAQNTAGRKPVVILLTDGAANTALDTLFDNDRNGTVRQVYYSNNIDPMIALSTLLSAAYNKANVADHYEMAPMIYGVGVDLSSTDGSNAIIDPKNNFNSSNTNANIRSAYSTYTNTWLAGRDVSVSSGTGSGWGSSNYTFRFGHEYPQGSAVTDRDIAENIHYVDTYYPVASAEIQGVFDQIYQELSSGVFNPITSSATVNGGTGVNGTPLIYVDHIGQYMEVKDIEAVTLFGSSYAVTKNAAGEYVVAAGNGTNPTTNESWNTTRDIRISITENPDGTQKLEIKIAQNILPIILEQVQANTVGEETSATITELRQEPLRVYYTIGVDSDILLPNGDVDVTKISSNYPYVDDTTGNITFYSNAFGKENTDKGGNDYVDLGDAHVGFKPAPANRYYYHQTNQSIFSGVEAKDGSQIRWEALEYGVVWEEDKYDLTRMSYAEYKAIQDTDNVYTYVTYYHPTPSAADAANAAEQVTYLVYMDWAYLKESIAFYDATTQKYINYNESTGAYSADDKGYVMSEAAIDAYVAANPSAEIYAVLGVGSHRTSRLHNMQVAKAANETGTADLRYAPVYTYDTAQHHNGNDVVVWLGNNGRLTTSVETGIALTKNVTEAIGNVEDTYAVTVTVPAGVTATPVVKNANGNDVTAAISTWLNNVLTVNVKAGETVYISGIPAGTICQIGEIIPGTAGYYIAGKTDAVTVPTLTEVLAGADQYAPASVTNAPYKYGQLTVIKDIENKPADVPEEMVNKVFQFKVQLPAKLAGQVYQVDKANASLFDGTEITVGQDGSFTVALKDNESITVLNLPQDITYTVTETTQVAGYTNTTGEVSGAIAPNGDHDAHFVNTYGYTAIKPAVTVTGTKILDDIYDTYNGNEAFTFVLSHYTGNGYEEMARTTARAGESYKFELDALLTDTLGLGNHYFRVTEESGDTNGMSYDSSRGLFVVRITDTNADGVLEYQVENAANTTVTGTTVTKNFTNIYNVQRTYADIQITKELVNNTGVVIPLNSFRFTMVNNDNANDIYRVTTDASGKAIIRIPELAAGVYTYTLTEERGTLAGMTYDETVHTVTISVTENSGVLTATVAIDGTENNAVTFRNTYALKATTHTISGVKKLEGRAPVNGEFRFALYETDESFAITGAAKETVVNSGEAFSFSAITYDEVGTYHYSVKELDTAVAGVTYDTTHYHITVTVGVDGDSLTKQVVINKIGHNGDTSGNVVFVNSYEAKPTEYALGGHKILHGRAPRDEEFSFQLYEGTELLETVTNKAGGTFTFAPISYTEVGTYTYTIKEVNGTVEGVRYDGVNTPVTVTVTVTDKGGVLSAEANVANANIAFENTYTPAPAQITFNGTKTLKGGDLADNTFAFKFYRTDNTFDITGSNAQLMATAQNVDGAFSFRETLTTTGTYYFVVLEDISNPMEKVVYDCTQHKFMVRVSDIGDGYLKAAITDVDTGNTNLSATAASVNLSFVNATFEEVTEKEVYLQSDVTTEIDGSKVEAGDVLTYFITYTNYTGENVVADILDTIPKHTSYVDGSASHNGSYAGTHLNWVLRVPKGGSVTVSFQVKVEETEAIVANTAVVRDGKNVYTTNEVVNHTVEKITEKDVFNAEDVTVSIDGKKVYAGDELVYTIRYTNTTGAPADVTITDTIPAHTAYVDGSADNGGVYASGKLTWNVQDVPAWETVTVSFKAAVQENVGAVTIANKATVDDGSNGYNTNEVTNYTVEDEVEKKVYFAGNTQVNVDGKPVSAGDKLIYTIRYTNTASEQATIQITDTIPVHTAYVDGSADNGGVYANGKITWQLDVAAKQSVTVSFAVTVKSGAENVTVANKAQITEGVNAYTTNTVTNKVPAKEQPPVKPDPKPPVVPQTGDTSKLWLWMGFAVISGFGAVATAVYGKKKESAEE